MVVFGYCFGRAVAECRAIVEAYERAAGFCDDNPCVLAIFVFEVSEDTHGVFVRVWKKLYECQGDETI